MPGGLIVPGGERTRPRRDRPTRLPRPINRAVHKRRVVGRGGRRGRRRLAPRIEGRLGNGRALESGRRARMASGWRPGEDPQVGIAREVRMDAQQYGQAPVIDPELNASARGAFARAPDCGALLSERGGRARGMKVRTRPATQRPRRRAREEEPAQEGPRPAHPIR